MVQEQQVKWMMKYIALFLIALVQVGAMVSWAPLWKEPLSFRVALGDEVALRIILSSQHYGLDDESSDEEWAKVLPVNGHLVHITKNVSDLPNPYTVTLFHQLKCLAINRAQYQLPQTAPIIPRTRHCMNYLRQTILCGLNLRLESVEKESGLTDRYLYDTVCRDWTKLYDEAERNQLAYEKWKNESLRGV
ncbi:hypothetical protein B0H11DRAFT_2199166 [Mycena galericulata]|nr:hypothetical protein B0H11DRAFT_2199166 [Mycena galericulata]